MNVIKKAANLADKTGRTRYVDARNLKISISQPATWVTHWRVKPGQEPDAHSGGAQVTTYCYEPLNLREGN